MAVPPLFFVVLLLQLELGAFGVAEYVGFFALFVTDEPAGGVGFVGFEVGFEAVVSGALATAPEEGTKAELAPLSLLISGTAMESGVERTNLALVVLEELSGCSPASA